MLKMEWTLNEHGRLIAHWQVCPSDQKLQPLPLIHRSIPTIEYGASFRLKHQEVHRIASTSCVAIIDMKPFLLLHST